MRSEPRSARTPVWPLSISLAATLEIDFSFSSSGYLDVSVHRVPLHTLWIGVWMIWVHHTGFPHSDICGSRDICSSPQLFAAYHVFRRLLVPRHPPCALISLTFLVSLDFISVWNLLLWVLSLLRFVICYYDCFLFDVLLSFLIFLRLISIFGFQGTTLPEFYQSIKRFASTTHSQPLVARS